MSQGKLLLYCDICNSDTEYNRNNWYVVRGPEHYLDRHFCSKEHMMEFYSGIKHEFNEQPTTGTNRRTKRFLFF